MKEELTQDYLKHRVVYYPDSGRMVWLTHDKSTLIGREVGGLTAEGYLACFFEYKGYSLHRLAFLYMTGILPSQQVDHINGVKSDNRWSNLRLVTNSENQQNARLRVDSTTGIKGLTKHKKRSRGNPYFTAEIKVRGEWIVKNKSFTPETEAAVKQELIDWLISQRNKLHGEFANHG